MHARKEPSIQAHGTERIDCLRRRADHPHFHSHEGVVYDLTAEEQYVMEHGHLRLLSCSEETARDDALIVEPHSLHAVSLVGEHLRYGFGSAYHCWT